MPHQNKLEPSALNVEQLFLARPHRYQIPKFQRSYCWTKENIDMLWEDIDSLSVHDQSRFLGAVILKAFSTPGGLEAMVYDVIDGQQRLTTLWMLVAVLTNRMYHLVEKAKEDPNYKQHKELYEHMQESAIRFGGLLIDQFNQAPKLTPSFVDRAEFNWALEYLAFLPVSPKKFEAMGHKKAGALELAVENIWDSLNERLSQHENDHERCCYLYKLIEHVRKNLELIEVILADYHDPNEVFDRLNIAGQELTVLDMARNELFRIFKDDDENAFEFYEQHWRPFEHKFEAPFDDQYPSDEKDTDGLKMYSKRVSTHKNGFWYPYALTINPDVTAQTKEVFAVLKSHWARIEEKDPQKKCHVILRELQKYVPVYNAVTVGIRPVEVDEKSRFWGLLSKISQYGVQSGAHAYLYRLIRFGLDTEDDSDIENVCKCLELVESYTIRRALCKDDGSVKNVFNPAWRLVGSDPELLLTILNDKSRPFYSNSQVIEELTQGATQDFYSLRKRATYCVVEHEKSLDADVLTYSKYTIDHVLPQKLKDQWPGISKNVHERVVNNWGNLVPLTKKMNAKKNNRSWKVTKDIYSSKSATASPRKIAKKKSWGAKDIRSRTNELGKWAVETTWLKPEQKDKKKYERELNKAIENRILVARSKLKAAEVHCSIFRITPTGHSKGNLTATKEFSEFLKECDYHDYESQLDGEPNKVVKEVHFYHDEWLSKHNMSLYKTAAKGEKRVWPNGLKDYCSQREVLAFCEIENRVVIVNCSNPLIISSFLSNHQRLKEKF